MPVAVRIRVRREAEEVVRCRVEAGSFFETAPSDGDLYVLRRVVHDFDDDDAAAILTNVRRHMPTGATLLLLESVVPPGNTPHVAKTLDLDMMVFVGGREHFDALMKAVAVNKLEPVIDKVFDFDAAPAAYKYLKSAQHFGKVVIKV